MTGGAGHDGLGERVVVAREDVADRALGGLQLAGEVLAEALDLLLELDDAGLQRRDVVELAHVGAKLADEVGHLLVALDVLLLVARRGAVQG